MARQNLICDLETGVCGPADEGDMELVELGQPVKTIDLYYVTDPICSHCWALEPALRRFVKQYGHLFRFHTVMGGLLEKWHGGPVDPANGIFGPADVAGHWREVGEHFRMPIDGSLMIDNPVQSSFPPSRVFKIIQRQHGEDTALQFLRRAREQLYVFNRNIGQADVLADIVKDMGLDGEAIVKEADGPTGHALLQEDFALMRSLGARGFPTIVMVNTDNKGVKIVGNRPFEQYVAGLAQVLGEEPAPQPRPSLSGLLAEEKLLFARELEVMYDLEPSEVRGFVVQELAKGSYKSGEFLGETYIALADFL